MSAGGFVKAKYGSTYDSATQIHPIRVQPETIACICNGVQNSQPVGTITNPISALVSRGRRARGLIARTVTLKSPPTDQVAGYLSSGLTTIPALNESFFAQCVAADNTTVVSYNGIATYKVAYVTSERVK